MMLCRVLVQECALFREGEVGRSYYDDEKRVWDWTLDFGGAGARGRGGFDLVSTYFSATRLFTLPPRWA
jgi:hypothetical protein